MTTQAVEPGRLLAGRYRVEVLLDEAGGARSWRAVDEVLSRPVYVLTLLADDERADELMSAAQAAAQVGDPRFLQILDVATEEGTAFVVREWFDGHNLLDLLVGGPLTGDQASALGREVAEALTVAHQQGLHHLRLEPACVLIGSNGSVKIAGLGTAAVLHGVDGEGSPAEIDAAGIGRILYAALTARWPGGDRSGLPPAPRIDGRAASPRQVRPGVPRLLDEVVDRTLNNADRHHAAPLASPWEVAEALTAGAVSSRSNGVLGDSTEDPGPPPAVIDQPAIPLLSNRAVPLAQSRPEDPPPGRTMLRVLGVVAAALFLIAATMIGWQLLLAGINDDTSARTDEPPPATGPTTEPTTSGPSTPPQETSTAPTTPGLVEIAAGTAFDPVGNGEENDEDAGLAFDGDTSTAWRTVTYYDPLELQKAGVGIYFDLGTVHEVSEIDLTLVGSDSDVEIRVAPNDSEPPSNADDWKVAGTASNVGETASVALDDPAPTRYVLVWFTRLPSEGGDFRGGVAEAEVHG